MRISRKGRCVLVILASQWDPIAVPALSVQRALFLVLEILIQDPRNQVRFTCACIRTFSPAVGLWTFHFSFFFFFLLAIRFRGSGRLERILFATGRCLGRNGTAKPNSCSPGTISG